MTRPGSTVKVGQHKLRPLYGCYLDEDEIRHRMRRGWRCRKCGLEVRAQHEALGIQCAKETDDG